MKTKLILTAVLVGSVCAGGAAEDYDFYAGVRYPGAKLRSDVELYKVKQSGKGDPKAYERREVDWWPRKGVDIIEVRRGMPLRTWTWKSKPLKAHLIGFRGIGNTMSNKFRGDGGPWEPGVVLRLEDGRKRCFVKGSFGGEDKKFIMDLYVNVMKRIKAGLDRTKRAKRPNADIRWPNNAKPGEPGTMQVESEHFIWISGSQAGSEGDPWVNAKAPDKAQWYRDGSVKCAEYWWAMLEYAGNLMPYWDRREKFKHEVTVAGTKRDGHQFIEGYAGGGYGGCILKGAGGGPWAPGLWHEWGHGALPNRIRVGGGEAQADMHQCLADPSMLKGNHHIKTPWRNVFNGSMGYGYTIFYSITGDDPNWGYAWFTCLPYGVEEISTMQAAARVGEQRGMFKNGIRGLGDMVGDYAARLATFDCELEELFRRRYYATRSWLETVDREKRVYRIPWQEAPEPYGVNIVRLVAGEGVGEFEVDFTGLHDPDLYGDWRTCIVAVGPDEKRRYSPMWNKGRMKMTCLPGDRAYWLTVAATPTAMQIGQQVQSIYSGRHAYRYPWSIQLSGARPGTPRQVRGEEDLEKNFRRHPNGGGWVANSAKVAATACIGPDAMVLGGAQVRDHAIVEDFAIVSDRALVSDHARISGRAEIKGNAKVGGYTRTWTWAGGGNVPSVLPKRLGAEKLHKYGLWANYAMDRDEKTLLEDWYRFPRGADRRYGRRLGTNLDGYLTGRPEFVVDGDHQGFRFDGRTQYGELCPRLADLGAITVEITLKWEGRGAQTVFDFGSSPDNCLMLKTARSGRPELVATVGGRSIVGLAVAKALVRNEWVSLRVEIDGTKAALWVGGEKVAEEPSTFRPCDAFPGGKKKRNFLAASREGTRHFKGIIDRVVVYHTVHDNFGKLPEPTMDAPRRPTRSVIEKITKRYGNIAELDRKIAAKARELNKPYDEYKKQIDVRIKELEERDPALQAAKAKLKRAEQALGKRKQEISKEFDRLPEAVEVKAKIDELRKQSAELRSRARNLKRERSDKGKEMDAIEAKRRELDRVSGGKDRALRGKRDKYVSKRTADMVRRVAAAKAAQAKANKKAMAPYVPEKLWAGSFGYQVYRGYYNTNYGRYIRDHAKALFGGAQRRDDIGSLQPLEQAVAGGEGWSTRVDWDWRMRQEADGSIKDLPLQQKWIRRARGPVVTEKPRSVR